MPLVLLAEASAVGSGSGSLVSSAAATSGGVGVVAGFAAIASAVALRSSSPTDSAAPRTIKVIDGYVRGAQVYVDTNRDGVADDNEIVPGVFTDELGSATLPVGAPQGPLIAMGGINTDTGLPNRMVLLAPDGSAVLTPLTTLAQHMNLNGWTVGPGDAANKVVHALGLALPDGTDLLTYDPVASKDLGVLRSSVSVAALVELAGREYKGRGEQAVSGLARELAASGAVGMTIDLFSLPESVQSALGEIGLSAAATNSIAASLSALRSATSIEAVTSLQSKVVSPPRPVAPAFELASMYSTLTKPNGAVQLAVGSVPVGSRAVAVDDRLVLSLFQGEQMLGVCQVVLQPSDIIQGTVPLELPVGLGDGLYGVEGFIDDPLGFQSPIASFDFEVDAVAAWASRVIVNAEGKPLNSTLSAGTREIATVVFDDNFIVTGIPTLAMRVDGRDVVAQYQRDASTPRTLVFEHVL